MKIGESKVTRGTITTIPKSVRLALKIKEGDVIEWHVEDGKIVVRKKQTTSQ